MSRNCSSPCEVHKGHHEVFESFSSRVMKQLLRQISKRDLSCCHIKHVCHDCTTLSTRLWYL